MPRPPLKSGFVCYHCGSRETAKAGFTRGKQRFYCRSCRRWFRENPVLPSGKKKQSSKRLKPLPSKSNLILELLSIAQSLGKTPTTADINRFSKAGRAHCLNTYYSVFGSFLEAVKTAKLKPRYKQEFSREKLLAQLRQLRVKLKRPLLGKDVRAACRKGKLSSIYHFERAFVTIPKAIEAAGAGRKIYSRDEMIAVLRKIDAELDRAVSPSDIRELFHRGEAPSYRAIEREFGGLAKARRAAGIKAVNRSESAKRWIAKKRGGFI